MPAFLQLQLNVQVQVLQNGACSVRLCSACPPSLCTALQVVPPVYRQRRLKQVVHHYEAHLRTHAAYTGVGSLLMMQELAQKVTFMQPSWKAVLMIQSLIILADWRQCCASQLRCSTGEKLASARLLAAKPTSVQAKCRDNRCSVENRTGLQKAGSAVQAGSMKVRCAEPGQLLNEHQQQLCKSWLAASPWLP